MSTIIRPVQVLNMLSKPNQYYLMEYHFEDKDDIYFRCFKSVEAIIQHINTNEETYNEETYNEGSDLLCSEGCTDIIYNNFVYHLPSIDGVSKQVIDYFDALY